MLELEWFGERLALMPERCLYWPRRRTLILADPHFGKAASFRNAGIPVPEAVTGSAIARLTAACDQTDAERLLILGDFLHARSSRQAVVLALLADWRRTCGELAVTLVRGNHDLHAGDPPAELGFESVAWIDDPPFSFWHSPDDAPLGRPSMAGHVHPCAALRSRSGACLRAPCFHLRGELLILPAFGPFTGGHAIRARVGDRVFVVGDEVVEIEVAARPRRASRGQA